MSVACQGAVLGLVAQAGIAATPIIDERFNEWDASNLMATDAVGDAFQNAFDLRRVHATTDGTTLFLAFEMLGNELNLQSGALPLGPQLSVTSDSGSELVVLFRGRVAAAGPITDQSQINANRLSWDELDIALLPTVASDRYEMRVDLAPAGFAVGDTISVNFVIAGLTDEAPPGSFSEISSPDALDAPIVMQLTPSTSPPTTAPDLSRRPGTTLRVASYNVLGAGLLSGSGATQARFQRMLAAADADVYCFQELNGSPATVAQRLESLIPAPAGLSWNVHTDPSTSPFGSDYIASTRPLIPVEDFPFTDRYAAAIVGDDPADATLVLSIHPKCCGFAGDSNDQRRIDEAEDTRDFIARFRAGAIAPELAPFAGVPVVVIGDWNLVGSDRPREILTDPSGPALRHKVLLNADGRDALTYRAQSGFGFMPGLLDLCAYAPQDLDAHGGFVLETTRFTAAQLAPLGLQPSDSGVSDHFLLVADFRPESHAADIDGDGAVNTADLLALLASFGDTAFDDPADVDDSGAVGTSDLLRLLADFGVVF